MALGGDPSVGMKLSARLKAQGTRADVIVLSEFRRSNVELHLRTLKEIDAARKKAEEAEAAAEAAAPAASAASGSTR